MNMSKIHESNALVAYAVVGFIACGIAVLWGVR